MNYNSLILIKKIFLFLNIIFSLKINCKLSFPIYINKTRLSLARTPNTIMYSLYLNEIYSNFSIGTPPQQIPITFKLQEYPFYILGPSTEKYNLIYFNDNLSQTYFSYKNDSCIWYNLDFDYGFTSYDLIHFNNNNNINFSFILAEEKSYERIFFMSGCIGLALDDEGKDYITNVNYIKQLKKNNLIDNFGFMLKFNNNNNNKHSEFIFNLNLSDYYGIHSNVVKYYNRWSIKFDNIIFQNKSISFDLVGGFYYTLGVIIYKSKKNFEIFFKDFIKNNICFESSFTEEINKYYFYYCNENFDIKKFNNITFYKYALNTDFVLTGEDLFIKIKNYYYFLIIFNFESLYDWKLGIPFLKKYNFAFDYEKKMIYLINNNNNNNISNSKENNFYYYIIIFILIIIIICLLYLIKLKYFNHNKKIRAKELISNYSLIEN